MAHRAFPAALEVAINCVANERHFRVAFDTHYDAGNYEIEWWRGKTRYRLDFQPIPEAIVSVTMHQDDFRFFPKFLAWAWRTIPMFPYTAKISHKTLSDLVYGKSENFYIRQIQKLIDKA